jgi:hypothetical protein
VERVDRELLDAQALVGHLVPGAACSRFWLSIDRGKSSCQNGGFVREALTPGSARGWASVRNSNSSSAPLVWDADQSTR